MYSNIIFDEINGIRYSQNELNNGNLSAIQLVNYLQYYAKEARVRKDIEEKYGSIFN